jgi:HEAT repeat protein
VRTSALRALGKAGVDPRSDAAGKVVVYLDAPEVSKRVWAAQALMRGGDEAHEKYLIGLVKEEPRLLTDMGELGEVLADLNLAESVPYLIQRLKHEKSEYRADAAEALARVTGLGLEYQSLDSEEQKRNAIKVYSRWWEDRKKERRKKGGE